MDWRACRKHGVSKKGGSSLLQIPLLISTHLYTLLLTCYPSPSLTHLPNTHYTLLLTCYPSPSLAHLPDTHYTLLLTCYPSPSLAHLPDTHYTLLLTCYPSHSLAHVPITHLVRVPAQSTTYPARYTTRQLRGNSAILTYTHLHSHQLRLDVLHRSKSVSSCDLGTTARIVRGVSSCICDVLQ